MGGFEDRAAAFSNENQNCLNPDFSCHRVSLEAAGMKTVCIDSRSMYPLESSRLVQVYGQNSAMEMHRGHGSPSCSVPGWLPGSSGCRGGAEHAIPLNKMSFFILENAGHP